MPRPKLAEENKLEHVISIRVSEKLYKKLLGLKEKSDWRSICELSRRILSNERIVLFNIDASMNGPMEELALIRKEVKSIGVNINQQTHHFHISQSASERAYYVMQTEQSYQKVDMQVAHLLQIVNKLSLKWLQKS